MGITGLGIRFLSLLGESCKTKLDLLPMRKAIRQAVVITQTQALTGFGNSERL